MIVEVLDPELVGRELTKIDTEAKLAPEEAQKLGDRFGAYYHEIVRLRKIAASLRNPDTDAKLARETRLSLKRIRCDVEILRKTLKDGVIRAGKAIDGYANVIKYECEPAEEALESIEKYAERKEAARIAAIVQDRTMMLVELGADPQAYNLGLMDENTWLVVLQSAKDAKADREEKARKEEADRIAKVEADRIAREKAEQEAAEARKIAEDERKKREDAEAKARADKAKADAELRKERDARAKAELEAMTAKRKEQERIAAEKAAADKAAQEAIELEAKKEAAPDMDKIHAYMAAIESIPVPTMTTDRGKNIMGYLQGKISTQLAYVRANIKG
jgi:DNA polymerase III gamma/tau subunit